LPVLDDKLDFPAGYASPLVDFIEAKPGAAHGCGAL